MADTVKQVWAISLLLGVTSAGLPIGVQLIGPSLAESRLLDAGAAFQQATDWHKRRPLLAAA